MNIGGNFAIIYTICAGIILGSFVILVPTSGYRDGVVFGQKNSIVNALNSNISSLNSVINKLNFTSASGTIASLQSNAWILSGQWHMVVLKPRLEENQYKPATVTFNTTFDMVGTDGTALHTHTISSTINLTSVSNSVNNNTHLSLTTINGTTKLVPVGLLNMIGAYNVNVPISIKIIDRSVLSLWIDPSKIGNHFGNTPIYGIIKAESG